MKAQHHKRAKVHSQKAAKYAEMSKKHSHLAHEAMGKLEQENKVKMKKKSK